MRTRYTADIEPATVDGRTGVAHVTVIHGQGHYSQPQIDQMAVAVYDTVLGGSASNIRAGTRSGDTVLVDMSLAIRWEGDD